MIRKLRIRLANNGCTDNDDSNDAMVWMFYYDGGGLRIKEEYWNGTITTTRLFLFGGSYEVEGDGGTTTTTKYYSIAGMQVAMDDGTDVYYFDHLTAVATLTVVEVAWGIAGRAFIEDLQSQYAFAGNH